MCLSSKITKLNRSSISMLRVMIYIKIDSGEDGIVNDREPISFANYR